MLTTYLAIDLKSFYASVECAERKLDPLRTHLVVADGSRTDKTICLAVSPSLKACGIPGRPRLFEVIRAVQEVNRLRLAEAHRVGKLPRNTTEFPSTAYNSDTLAADPSLGLSYITAPPRMNLYMTYSTRIFSIYMKYVAPEDIHVYSVDECFINIGPYLDMYRMDPRTLAMTMIRDVLYETGITATCGIGSNLYLAKIAMDIVAKHVPADKDGVRIAELDEMTYRRTLWAHQPITDFWRIGPGIAATLAAHQMFTMGDIARCSLGKSGDLMNEALLYRLFGVNAELIIDHAWGWEPCTIPDIKQCKPKTTSLGHGQVLASPYPFDKARIIVCEMADLLAMNLTEKEQVTDQIVLTVSYDKTSLSDGHYKGEIVSDHYGRPVPRHAHGSARLGSFCSSAQRIVAAALALYDRVTDPTLLIRRINLTAANTVRKSEMMSRPIQLSFFSEEDTLARIDRTDTALQQAAMTVKKRYGRNALLKGFSYEDGATARERNNQIGGHKAE